MYTKDDLNRLIDQLPDNELLPAMRYLEQLRNMGDRVLKTLMEAPKTTSRRRTKNALRLPRATMI